mgnify:CR=1 FL=1|jgi:hypothetical protein
MNLYQKNVIGRKYVRLMTGSPFPYLVFLAGLIALFLFLTLSTKVDLIKTYQIKAMEVDGTPVLSVAAADIPVGRAFLYANKNQNVYPVHIQRTETHEDGTFLYLEGSRIWDDLRSLGDQTLYLDVPQGEATLLYFILVKGGKGGG